MHLSHRFFLNRKVNMINWAERHLFMENATMKMVASHLFVASVIFGHSNLERNFVCK